MSKCLAVIPARGGSKRIPKKNIRLFNGKPIIAYSIEAAIKSDCFDQVIVSTDSEEIAKVANEYGAQTPFYRPAELADDFSGTNAVARHALEWFQEQGSDFTHACCIYATAPFVSAELIQSGWKTLQQSDSQFAVTVTTFPFAIQRAMRVNQAGIMLPFYPEHSETRSQDLEEGYHDVGQIYWGRASAFLKDHPLFADGERETAPIFIPRKYAQDIDTEEDWQEAELRYQLLQRELN